MIDSEPDPIAYLAGLRLAGRRVVMIGAGRVAARRLAALERAAAQLVVVAPEAEPAVVERSEAGSLLWQRRSYVAGDLAGAWYAMAATDDPDTNAAVVAEAEERMIFCVRADDASGGTAWTPATEVAGQVQIGLLSVHPEHHRDPARTRRLRDRLVQLTEEIEAGQGPGSGRDG